MESPMRFGLLLSCECESSRLCASNQLLQPKKEKKNKRKKKGPCVVSSAYSSVRKSAPIETPPPPPNSPISPPITSPFFGLLSSSSSTALTRHLYMHHSTQLHTEIDRMSHQKYALLTNSRRTYTTRVLSVLEKSRLAAFWFACNTLAALESPKSLLVFSLISNLMLGT